MDITITRTTDTFVLGKIESIPLDEGRVFQVEDVRVAVFRTRNGNLYATQADCPHRGGPLADGVVGAGRVICPLHANAFDLATGAALSQSCRALTIYTITTDAKGDMLLTITD